MSALCQKRSLRQTGLPHSFNHMVKIGLRLEWFEHGVSTQAEPRLMAERFDHLGSCLVEPARLGIAGSQKPIRKCRRGNHFFESFRSFGVAPQLVERHSARFKMPVWQVWIE